MAQKIGFIGLGAMGLPMLENLSAGIAGQLLAFDKSDVPFDHLGKLPAWGATLGRASTLSEMAGCEFVILMLPNSAITNTVVLGAEGEPGLIDILGKGAIIIDMGSSDPLETRRIGKLLEQRGVGLIDAPVSGAVARARVGDLAIMVGGDEERFKLVKPILDRMGSTIIHVGSTGDAHAMKALNNYVYAAGLLAVAEALCIAEAQNLDRHKFAEILNASSGSNVASKTKVAQFILPETYNGGFLMRLQAKDLRIAAALGSDAGVEANQLALCTDLWTQVSDALPGADNTDIHRFLRNRARQASANRGAHEPGRYP